MRPAIQAVLPVARRASRNFRLRILILGSPSIELRAELRDLNCVQPGFHELGPVRDRDDLWGADRSRGRLRRRCAVRQGLSRF